MKNHIKIVPYILALLLFISLMTISLMIYNKESGAPKPLSEGPLLSKPVKPSFPAPVKPPFPDFVVPGPR